MNNGLVVLAGWLQWGALVVLLVVAIAREVAGHHEQRSVTYERDRSPDSTDGTPRPDGAD